MKPSVAQQLGSGGSGGGGARPLLAVYAWVAATCTGITAVLALYACLSSINAKLALLSERSCTGTGVVAVAAAAAAEQQQQQQQQLTLAAAQQQAASANLAGRRAGPGGGSTARVAAAAATSSSLAAPDAYFAEAAANISAFRAGLLSSMFSAVPAKRGFSEADWPLFAPILSCPPGRPLRKYGQGDGSKLLCDLGARHLQSDCVIYSLGSNGDYQFEQAMLAETGCEIHTFDCTYKGKSIAPGRHVYHEWCIGSAKPEFKRWADITKELGHGRVDLLKMDIEGHEYPVLSEFRPDDTLPVEISIELHAGNIGGEHAHPIDRAGLGLIFLGLANLGYGAYSQEVNVGAPACCSEFAFARVWPLSGAGGAC